jgi:hypothetical protein
MYVDVVALCVDLGTAFSLLAYRVVLSCMMCLAHWGRGQHLSEACKQLQL